MAAMDLINGTVQQAMRTVALGGAPGSHGREVASGVLRGLGMEWAEAKRTAQRALPPFPPMNAGPAARADAAMARAKKAKRAAT